MRWVRKDSLPIGNRQRVPVVSAESGEEATIEVVNGRPQGAVYVGFGSDIVRPIDPSPEVLGSEG